MVCRIFLQLHFWLIPVPSGFSYFYLIFSFWLLSGLWIWLPKSPIFSLLQRALLLVATIVSIGIVLRLASGHQPPVCN
jgi:hypothetical protein